ncbi:MAG: hypothetical protein JNL60_02685 [Bacteroidia bacterium]|nr:hypothetical protein [Bacteroidia bacterium]
MVAVTATSFFLSILLGLPTLTYFCAEQNGRNPKLWFLFGFFTLGLATIVLSFLPDLSEKKEPGTTDTQNNNYSNEK